MKINKIPAGCTRYLKTVGHEPYLHHTSLRQRPVCPSPHMYSKLRMVLRTVSGPGIKLGMSLVGLVSVRVLPSLWLRQIDAFRVISTQGGGALFGVDK